MEKTSPSSATRVTGPRAQLVRTSSMEKGKCGSVGVQSKNDRSALLDITNDSPIVGVATGGGLQSPASSVAKAKRCPPLPRRTPGSGEALLRGQVKALLQRVEEESDLVVPPTADDPAAAFRALLGHLRSPNGLLAPTPTNTPLVLPLSQGQPSHDVVVEQAVSAAVTGGPPHLEECQVNRALTFDSPEKSDSSGTSSSLTFEGSPRGLPEKLPSEDDCSSTWSVQANAGSEAAQVSDLEGDFAAEDGDGDDGGVLLDDLCEGFRNMSVGGGKEGGLPEFAGRHTRFLYDSDGEPEGEEEVVVAKNGRAVSPNVVLLKGLPVPEGKHLRFQEEEDGDDEE